MAKEIRNKVIFCYKLNDTKGKPLFRFDFTFISLLLLCPNTDFLKIHCKEPRKEFQDDPLFEQRIDFPCYSLILVNSWTPTRKLWILVLSRFIVVKASVKWLNLEQCHLKCGSSGN